MVLYADILFAVDMSMDWLTLALCARLTHMPTSGKRLLLASMVGAVGSVLLVVLGAQGGVTFGAGILLSALMTAIAFGLYRTCGRGWKRWRAFGRQWLTVWGCGAVTGGVLSVLMSLGEPVYIGKETPRENGFLPLFLATAVVIYGFLRLVQKRITAKTATVTIGWQGREGTLTVLVDTGNLLTEPMTGKPVLLLSANAAHPLHLPTGENPAGLFFPVIAKGATGTRLLWAIRPEKLEINGKRREALVAAEDVPADHYGGMGGTCPGCLVE